MKRGLLLVAFVLFAFSVFGQGKIDIVAQEEYVASTSGNSVYGSKIVSWSAYMDGLRMSEMDFYKTVGDSKAVADLEQRKTTMWTVLGGSVALAVLGAFAITSPNETVGIVGITALGLSSAGFGVTVSLSYPARPLPYVQRLADKYNSGRK